MYKRAEKVKLICDGLKEGQSLAVATIKAGVKSQSTIENWRRENPRIDKLITRAEDLCLNKRISMVVDANLKSALAGNVAAQCFFLKNKAGWKDVDAPVVNIYTQIWNGAIKKQENVDEDGRIVRERNAGRASE